MSTPATTLARRTVAAVAVLAVCATAPASATPRAARTGDAARATFARTSALLACSRPAPATRSRAACLADALTARPARTGTGTSATQVPVCLDQAAAVNNRCETWSRAFNDRSPDGSTVNDSPGGFAVNRKGDKLFVATTTRIGAARSRLTVAAMSAKNGATLWLGHPPTNQTTEAVSLVLSPDESTVIVAGRLTYLPNLNAVPLVWWFTSGYSARNGRYLWSAIYKTGGTYNTPVAIRTSPRGDRVYVTGYSVYSGYQRPYVEWVTVAYSSRGRQLWLQRYGGRAGGQNVPVGLAVSPRGDTVYVGGSSEHPQTTGDYAWDYGAIAYDARTGRTRWTTVSHVTSSQQPVALAVSPRGDRVYLTGGATYGTATQPVLGMLTIGLAARTGKPAWTSRHVDASGLSATATALAVSPKDGRVLVAAAVGQRKTVVAGTLEPSVLTITTFGLDPRSGRESWHLAYAPDPDYSAVPTAITVNARGTTFYLAGVVGPPTLLAAYPVTFAATTSGKQSWVARYDLRDPGSAGVGIGGFPAVPVAVIADRAGRNVYASIAYHPALPGLASTECDTAHAQGVGQDCDPTGETDLVLAYAK